MYEAEVEGGPPGFRTPHPVDVFVADVQGNPGNSGGPAYRIGDAAVVGVCLQVQGAPTWNARGEVGAFAANAGLTVIRPARYVLELMDEVGV